MADLVGNPKSREELLLRLQQEMDRPPFHAVLRPVAEGVDAHSGAVRIRLPFRLELGRDPSGDGYHGGAIAALIDLTAHAAVAVQTGRMAPTIDLRIDYLRVASASDLLATGKIVHMGRTLARVDVTVEDLNARLIAVGRGTFSQASG